MKFKVKLWNENSKVAIEPQLFYTFIGSIWYIIKYYYKSKKHQVNYMTNFSIEIIE